MSSKCIPIIIFGIIILSLLGVILISYFEYKLTTEKPTPIDRHNNSKCHSQFDLEDSIRVSVCHISKIEQLVDIRVFINNKPTIKGIQLRPYQWENLLSYAALVDYKLRNGP